MNKFKLFSAATLCLVAVSASAQQKAGYETTVEETENGRIETTVTTDKYKVETNRFFDNCFISVGVGAQAFLGDNEKHMHTKDLLTPAIDVSVGKWFSPGLGLQLSYSGYKIKGLWADHYAGQNFKTDKPYDDPKKNYHGTGKLYEQKAKFFNVHAEGLVNLSNIIGGYKPTRFYSVIPYVGVGWIRSYDHEGRQTGDITFNGGIINNFRICDALDAHITIRGAVTDDAFDGEVSGNYYMGPADSKPANMKEGGQNRDADGYVGVTVGVTYKFKQRGWDKARTIRTIESNDKVIARLQTQIDDLQAKNNALLANNSAAQAEPKATEKTEIVTFPYMVNFVIDKIEVVNREKVNLGYLAQMMKATPDKKYMVSGYADKFTGSVARNIWLAEHRANNVCKVLTEEFGVPAEQLVVGSHGGVDNMFYSDPQLSRSVLISEAKSDK